MDLCHCTAHEAAGALDIFDRLFAVDVERRVKRTAPGARTIRKIEDRLTTVLQSAWVREGGAIDELLDVFDRRNGEPSTDEILSLLARAERQMGGDALVAAVEEPVAKGLAKAYDVGRESFLPRPSFNLVDEGAKNWLAENNLFWIGEHYGAEVGPRIAETVRTQVIEAGLSRREAGQALRETFEAEFGARSDAYWRGTAANATTRARNFGAVESFVEAEFEELEIVSVMDERTSDICRALNGKVYRVEMAVAQRDRMLDAKDPEAVKAAAPWPKKAAGLKALSAAQLASSGIVLPPYHFHCRTTVVVR